MQTAKPIIIYIELFLYSGPEIHTLPKTLAKFLRVRVDSKLRLGIIGCINQNGSGSENNGKI